MWEFIVQKGVGIAWGILAMAAQLAGYTNVAIALALVAVAAFFFVAPIWHHGHAWHRNRLDRGLRSVEASHLMMVALSGIIVFSAVALGALIWRTPIGIGAPPTKVAAITPASPPPPPIVLTEEDRRFREELRRFILSDINNLVQAFSSFSVGSANTCANNIRNNRPGPPPVGERERFEAVYELFDGARKPYEQTIKPLLDAANRPVEQIDLVDIENKLKIFSTAYRDDANTYYRFVIASGCQPDADAQDKWRAADDRVGVSFQNLQTFQTSGLVDRWRGTGVYNGGLYEWFWRRMRDWEALNAKK